MMDSIIQISELIEIFNHKNLTVIDTRISVSDYQQEHISGAFHLSLNRDLSNILEDAAHGGRHPLPDVKDFSHALSAIGVDAESHCIVYDDNNGSLASARLWWMLKAAGIPKVQVLNGGLNAAKSAKLQTDNKIVNLPEPSCFTFSQWQLNTTDIKSVENVSKQKDMIVDVRSYERYIGKKEPIDPIAGHIPGALNIPFEHNLDENGFFLSKENIENLYLPYFDKKDSEHIIFHCGSGVTACHSLLALDYAGFNIPKLYVGSWSEWIRNNKPIAKGNLT